ncbi:MAG: FAD-dependent thymidylate synthase [Candidatus Margulisbacteria bacterium]|nr:FAD-dependent thymidylate synthase [Candidatus Margulisiibacteriota bacterium]
MQIILAGYNVDTEVLEELKANSNSRQDVTPETLSASYARISRDPRPINELRKIARQEVEKARKSNSAIIFKMGHHSIAEHAVFNFDLLEVSRLAMEEIEKFRLCAYTEKSQRYQKLEDNYLIPEEIKGSDLEKVFVDTINKQNAFYQEMVGKGIEPEDARYITSLATLGQVGQTINARNLEFLFRRFASNPLAEVRQIGSQMYKLVEKIAPSIILFTQANEFDEKTYLELRTKNGELGKKSGKGKEEVVLADSSKDADNKLLAALLHSSTNLPYKKCLSKAKKMTELEKKELIKTSFKYAEFYDRPLREFEYVDLTYDLIVSAACFGQLKRHRMATITVQPYEPKLGVTIPDGVKKTGMEDQFNQIINITNKAFAKIAIKNSLAAQYVLTNAHRRRVLIKTNTRELYHISRLREDKHAQWDIQQISVKMTELAKEVMPLSMMLIGGKDRYPEIFESVFGKKPRVLPEF